MIVCISANPAIDRRIRVRNFRLGEVNRADSVQSFAGGKAAHVAMAARVLGEDVTWVGFLGGSTGDEIERHLNERNIEVISVHTMEPTRINDEIIDQSGTITEILEPGSAVTTEEVERLIRTCTETFAKYSGNFTTVFSGSLPPDAPVDLYKQLITAAHEYAGQTILDTSGEALLKGLKARPGLVKPNADEAESATGLSVADELGAYLAVRRLNEMGAESVTLTLGQRGIISTNGDTGRILTASPPKLDVISTVGCGDAAVAGLAVAGRRQLSDEGSLRLAAACGAANCLAALPGQINVQDVERLMSAIEIRGLDINEVMEA